MFSSQINNNIDELDDSDNKVYDDGILDPPGISHLKSLLNSLLSTEKPDISAVPSVENYSSNTIRSAFGVSSHSSSDTTASSSISGDSIHSYIYASPFFQTTANTLFITNVVYTATWYELKQFFLKLGYHVIHVNLANNHVNIGNVGYGSIQFGSMDIAQDVLDDFSSNPQKFVFKNCQLQIHRDKNFRQQMETTFDDQLVDDNRSNVVNFDIKNVRYGTFITETAMNHITGNNKANGFGFIVYERINNANDIRIRLRIDQKDKRISIIVSYKPSSMQELLIDFVFEWTFDALKGEKIIPVLINQSTAGLLIELTRPPIIFHNYPHNIYNAVNKTRISGTSSIGHANAWFFQLAGKNVENDYKKLSQILCPQRFSEDIIVDLISPPEVAKERLQHVQMLFNNKWVKENHKQVTHFLNYRWLHYPFETKFELMKLLAKHIVTIHHLIIDQQFDKILAQCSLNTFIVCTDTIVEFAHHWLHNTPSNEESLGYLSRFLLQALDQLKSKHELRQNTVAGVHVTKHEVHELHTTNENLSIIRKVYITPSTILYEGPYHEEKSLVTRHFTHVQDGFLRVTFRDEDYRKLHNISANFSKLYDRVKAILINGINICGKHYDFLAFSNSQLRGHSCWMFSSMNNISASSIRNWVGDFQHICPVPVAKIASRMGLSFSTTKKGLQLKQSHHKPIIDTRSGKSCFTDGIGIIAPWLVEDLCKALCIDNEPYRPCAFQIRFSGWKGMVCLDVARHIKQPDVGLLLRRSMNKFKSNNYSIDVVHASSIPSAGFLNRQIIILLLTLGIDGQIFLSMQEQMLEHLRTLTEDHQKAREFLCRFSQSGGNGYHAFLLEYLKRFGERADPFARRILRTFQNFLVKQLRTKTHILVPDTWTLFGVIDETKTLRYGEVFIQIQQKNDCGELISRIIIGSVIVTRHPCFHPGDIRRLKAIDIPALHGLKNVIVFPMNGRQSHPAEMGGGDLDGDMFWISHEQQLLFNKNEEPFDYHDHEIQDAGRMKAKTNTVYDKEAVCDFFVEYIKSDNLGIIANNHLAFADRSPLRAKASECLELARMYSTTVDFAKHGVRAPHLTSKLRLKEYPHFMEDKYKPSYNSKTVLGQLYDAVKKFENDLNNDEQQSTVDNFSFPYEALVIDGSDAYMEDAAITKNEYEFELRRVMRQYGIENEAELVSGYILKFTAKEYAEQEEKVDLKTGISHAVKTIQDKYLHIFYEKVYRDANDRQELIQTLSWSDAAKRLTWKNQLDWFHSHIRTKITNGSEIAKKASAWFRVTYEWLNQNRETQDQYTVPPLLSYAWIVYPVLMKIYDEKNN